MVMVWSLTRPSLPYVKFKVTTLEFAYKFERQFEENIQHSMVTASGIAYTLLRCCRVSVWTVSMITYLLTLLVWVNWHASCLLYPLAVLAVNEPSVNFAS